MPCLAMRGLRRHRRLALCKRIILMCCNFRRHYVLAWVWHNKWYWYLCAFESDRTLFGLCWLRRTDKAWRRWLHMTFWGFCWHSLRRTKA